MPRLSRSIILVLLAITLAPATAHAAFGNIVVIGDSLSDTGNVYDLSFGIYPPSPPHFDGRITNGPVWHETTAGLLGLPGATPHRLGGLNYAYGGAETGPGTTFIFPLFIPNLGAQTSSYLGNNTVADDELFIVWGGANNLLDGPTTDPTIPAAHIADHVTQLAAAGGRFFLVPNLPSLGETPRFKGGPDEAAMDALTRRFNDDVDAALAGLAGPDVNLFRLDTEAMFDQILADPLAYGFTNTTDQLINGGTPGEYLFWDDVHPTATAHALLGQRAYQLLTNGDADASGDVSFAEAAAVVANIGLSGATATDGDANGDGIVSLEEARASVGAYRAGQLTPPPDVTVVPEPAASLVLLFLSPLALRRATRGRYGNAPD